MTVVARLTIDSSLCFELSTLLNPSETFLGDSSSSVILKYSGPKPICKNAKISLRFKIKEAL